jgi:hypothetical protein
VVAGARPRGYRYIDHTLAFAAAWRTECVSMPFVANHI